MDTEYHAYAIGDRVMTNHGVGTVKDFELDGNGLGGMVTVLFDRGCVHMEEGAKVRPLLTYEIRESRVRL
ncbi:MAG: hypothetical protein ACYCU8_03780 [Ferrimicrobium acidiphilum]